MHVIPCDTNGMKAASVIGQGSMFTKGPGLARGGKGSCDRVELAYRSRLREGPCAHASVRTCTHLHMHPYAHWVELAHRNRLRVVRVLWVAWRGGKAAAERGAAGEEHAIEGGIAAEELFGVFARAAGRQHAVGHLCTSGCMCIWVHS